MGRTLLISVKPEYAGLIETGAKTVELRRRKPSVTSGDAVAIYVSSPDRMLRVVAGITGVIAASPSALWNRVGKSSGLTRKQFLAYFAGVAIGYAIVLSDIRTLPAPRSLAQLRRIIPGFCPPQVYRYLSIEQSRLLGLCGAMCHRAA